MMDVIKLLILNPRLQSLTSFTYLDKLMPQTLGERFSDIKSFIIIVLGQYRISICGGVTFLRLK